MARSWAPEELSVLLVEEDAAVKEGLVRRLEADGYEVLVAGDGEEALARATETAPDLIFVDLRSRASQGLRALERLRRDERTRFTPMVVLSDHDETDLRRRGLQPGSVDHLIRRQPGS